MASQSEPQELLPAIELRGCLLNLCNVIEMSVLGEKTSVRQKVPFIYLSSQCFLSAREYVRHLKFPISIYKQS